MQGTKLRNQRSKSEAAYNKSQHQCTAFHTKALTKNTYEGGETRRCQCCQSRLKYPDYLAELRRQRLERIQKKIAQAETFIDSPIPMIESKHMDEEIVSEFNVGEGEKNFIAKLSNKISEYEETPRKSMLYEFHESIIRSGSRRRSISNSLKKHSVMRKNESNGDIENQEEVCKFEIQAYNADENVTYARKFTSSEYLSKAIAFIEEILARSD